ncbi:hypothetical protein [Bradyrhizobium sp. SZCCHNRI1002]|uniref:hypothetical protein n=1 Tax=Bradyrhizobium sp. SZCCHNRI1002 TaxID=3057274 RepID=UPI0028E4B03B|nr:hypothetical protein [Bradyrhizobium sp. SZCCHNRI1002]
MPSSTDRVFIGFRTFRSVRAEVDDYRRHEPDLPNLNDAINQILRLGIDTARRRRESEDKNAA